MPAKRVLIILPGGERNIPAYQYYLSSDGIQVGGRFNVRHQNAMSKAPKDTIPADEIWVEAEDVGQAFTKVAESLSNKHSETNRGCRWDMHDVV